jgi:hypothetical protein
MAGGIVIAVSAEGQLIALIDEDKGVSLGWSFCGDEKTSAEPGGPADVC